MARLYLILKHIYSHFFFYWNPDIITTFTKVASLWVSLVRVWGSACDLDWHKVVVNVATCAFHVSFHNPCSSNILVSSSKIFIFIVFLSFSYNICTHYIYKHISYPECCSLQGVQPSSCLLKPSLKSHISMAFTMRVELLPSTPGQFHFQPFSLCFFFFT